MAENAVKPTRLPWAEFRKGCVSTEAHRFCVVRTAVFRGVLSQPAGFCEFHLECSGDTKPHEQHCPVLGAPRYLTGVRNIQYSYFICYAFGFFSMASSGRDKNQRENCLRHTILLTAMETLFILHLQNRSSPLFFGGAPHYSACAFHLCSAGGTPLDGVDMYSTHQASAEQAIDSLCTAAWGEEYFSILFLAF